MSGISRMSSMRGTHAFLTKSITDAAKKIVEEEEMDMDLDTITSRRIGRTLGKMRFRKADKRGGRERAWGISLDELGRWCTRYAYDLSQILGIDGGEIDTTHSTNAANAADAANAAKGDVPTWVLVDDFTRSINATNAVNAANAADNIPSPPAQKLDNLPQFDLWGGLL